MNNNNQNIKDYIPPNYKYGNNRKGEIMNDAKSLEKHLKLVNSVIISTNDLVNSLKVTDAVDDVIYSTVSEIFNFLTKILRLTPELLISNFIHSLKKSDLNIIFDNVIYSWGDYMDNPEAFYDSWDEFYAKWNKFHRAIENINLSQQTIFLSLN